MIEQYICSFLPIDGKSGKLELQYILMPNLFVLLQYRKDMKEWLNRGTSILVDRYAYSGVAYTASKGYDWDWCLGPDKGLIAPDLVVYLSASSAVLESRSGYGEERYENKAFQCRVAQVFEKLKTNKWLTVPSDRPIEEITHEIITPMRNIISHCWKNGVELGTLWTDG